MNLLAYLALCAGLVAVFAAAWSVLEWFATGRLPSPVAPLARRLETIRARRHPAHEDMPVALLGLELRRLGESCSGSTPATCPRRQCGARLHRGVRLRAARVLSHARGAGARHAPRSPSRSGSTRSPRCSRPASPGDRPLDGHPPREGHAVRAGVGRVTPPGSPAALASDTLAAWLVTSAPSAIGLGTMGPASWKCSPATASTSLPSRSTRPPSSTGGRAAAPTDRLPREAHRRGGSPAQPRDVHLRHGRPGTASSWSRRSRSTSTSRRRSSPRSTASSPRTRSSRPTPPRCRSPRSRWRSNPKARRRHALLQPRPGAAVRRGRAPSSPRTSVRGRQGPRPAPRKQPVRGRQGPASSPTRCCSATSTTPCRCSRASTPRARTSTLPSPRLRLPDGSLALMDLIGLDPYEILDTDASRAATGCTPRPRSSSEWSARD